MHFPYKIIDLTHELNSNIPTWNNDCGFKQDININYENCEGEYKFRVMKMNMHAGIGTHMDAPAHCIEGGAFINDFDVNELVFNCVVIDLSNNCNENLILSVKDILNFEDVYGIIPENCCVIINTGWAKYWHDKNKYHNNHIFPSISIEAAQLLLKRNISAIGIDTLSPDLPHNGFKVHNLFLGANKIIIENIANLDNMPAINSLLMILPMKIKNATEAPLRLIGLIEK